MYNKELNDKCIETFAEYISGKRVIVVGNALTMFSDKYGKFIDSFDVVVRLGKGIPWKTDKEYLGTKTDVWFFGGLRAELYEVLTDVPWKIFSPAQMNSHKSVAIPYFMMDGKFQVYKDFFLSHDNDEILSINEALNGKDTDVVRVSQGIMAVDMLAKIGTQKSLTVIGFDFFSSGTNMKFGYGKGKIPKDHPVTSWHFPLTSNSQNPHISSLERKYVESLDGVELIEMPKHLDHEKLLEMVKRLRGDRSSIYD